MLRSLRSAAIGLGVLLSTLAIPAADWIEVVVQVPDSNREPLEVMAIIQVNPGPLVLQFGRASGRKACGLEQLSVETRGGDLLEFRRAESSGLKVRLNLTEGPTSLVCRFKVVDRTRDPAITTDPSGRAVDWGAWLPAPEMADPDHWIARVQVRLPAGWQRSGGCRPDLYSSEWLVFRPENLRWMSENPLELTPTSLPGRGTGDSVSHQPSYSVPR